jgi:cob(I)alamin adenosyltransferase
MNLKKGYVQVYTGNGKGKTTAALGQALRAAGSGLKTLIVQFMKDFPYGETKTIPLLGEWVTLDQYGNDAFVFDKQPPSERDIHAAQQALKRAQEALLSGKYDMVILDEVCVAVHFSLLKIESVLPLLELRPKSIELIFTGRYCPEELIKRADLVTEMKEIKHYYEKGVQARKGIES